MAALFLNVYARWRWVVTSRSGRFNSGKKPQYPLNSRVDETRNRSGSFGEGKIKFIDRLSPKSLCLETCSLPASICQVVPVNKHHAMEVYHGPTSTARSMTLNSNKNVKYECGLCFCPSFPVKPRFSFSFTDVYKAAELNDND
jgi:hypothetical protein